MNQIANMKRGKEAQWRGQAMETLLHKSAEKSGWHVIKIPMGAKQVSAVKMIRVQTPWDFCFVKNSHFITQNGKPAVIFCDAKTIQEGNCTFAAVAKYAHQVEELLELEKRGFIAGFIINFTKSAKTVFIKASKLNTLTPRTSVGPDDGILIGDNAQMQLDMILTSPLL